MLKRCDRSFRMRCRCRRITTWSSLRKQKQRITLNGLTMLDIRTFDIRA